MPPTTGFKYLDPDVLRSVASIELKAKMLVEGLYASRHRSPFYGHSAEFVDHRDYAPGDEPKLIDWRVFGRTDRLYVKRLEMESNMNVLVLLDTSASMGYAPLDRKRLTKLEYACYLTAALGYLVCHQQDATGLITFDRDIRQFVPARQGERHLHLMFSVLEDLEPNGETDLSAVLTRLGHVVTRKGLVVVLSDFHDEPDTVAQGLRLLAARGHDVIVFQILDHDEIEWPFEELSNFRDLETGHTVMGDPMAMRERYLKNLNNLIETVSDACKACGADHRLIDTSQPIQKVLRDYLLLRAAQQTR